MHGLFVGIGGTGDWILVQLKDKVYATSGEIPDTLQFRLIDTEAEEYRRSKGARLGGESAGTAITTSEYLQIKDDPVGTFYHMTRAIVDNPQSQPEMANWFRAGLFIENLVQADFNLVRGAGQHRQFARMGAFLNKERLINLFRGALQRCSAGLDGEVPIWIIGSVAGGTGAGLFMDLALLARWVAEGIGVRHRIIGAPVLPEVFHEVGIDSARAYAVLRELQRFQAPVASEYTGRQDGGFRYSVSFGGDMTVRLKGPLFDNLVFYNRRCESEDDRRSYFSEIADGLNLLLDESAGDQLFRDWINVEEGYGASFNSFRVFLPTRLYRRQFVLQGALDIARGLLPQDQQGFVMGDKDDRCREAAGILGQEILKLFGDLLMRQTGVQGEPPPSTRDFELLSREMTSEYIVNTMLSFSNPRGVFGMDIGETREHAARRLWANICGDVDTIEKVKEDFDASKIRIKAEVSARRRLYDGDGEGSFANALAVVRGLVEEHLRNMIDASARKYLRLYAINEQAMGRANRVFIAIKDLLAQVRRNLERLVADDRKALEDRKGQETNALIAMEQLKPTLWGWGGKRELAESQKDYLGCVDAVVRWEQREHLTVFLQQLITLADQRFTRWLEGLADWQQAIERVITLSQNENNDILQRLDRQTKVRSASMGLKNTMDMDGYRELLQGKCTQDAATRQPYIPALLNKLLWRPGEQPHELALEGWPGHEQGITSKDFDTVLNQYLEDRVGQHMNSEDGMANYLEWLRDEKRDSTSDLADVMKKVTRGFVDTRQTSNTRKFLFLHGDIWDIDKHNRSPNAFDAVYNDLRADANFTQLEHNLLGSDGINLFKDRNVIAVLMVDKKIPYSQIPIISQRMRPAYLDVRNESNPPWRAHTYHLFRCDQEAWRIEREQVMETGDREYPLIPPQYVRLLDEPARVQLFAQALAVGVIREQESTLGRKDWVCGPQEDERRLVYLTDPGLPHDKPGPNDLHRALVTFVLDQQDRRPNQRGRLDLRQVRVWVEEQLRQQNRKLPETIAEFRKNQPALFDIPAQALEETSQDEAARTQAFFGLILTYYLIQKKQ